MAEEIDFFSSMCEKLIDVMFPRTRMQVWFVRICSTIFLWTCLVQLVTVGELWHPRLRINWNAHFGLGMLSNQFSKFQWTFRTSEEPVPEPQILPPLRFYKSNGFLKVSCNGGLNQMRAAICDMVTIARLLNLTLILPELDKKSFWADPSNFGDIFDVRHFVDSLRDEVHIIKRLPKKFNDKLSNETLTMAPVSWSTDKYYLEQILPLFSKHKVVHFNKTDARLANNGLPIQLQMLRCRANYHALKFTPQIEALGNKLIHILRARGSFVVLHLRYEMDMLAFSGCTHGCSREEAEELKRMRYAYPWWREKEIISEAKRLQGLCPLTPEEASLVLQAMGFQKNAQIYIASGEIYGSDRKLATLRAAFPRVVKVKPTLMLILGKKDMLLDPKDLQRFQNHSSQMAALDYMVSIASDIFIPTYDGNMAKVVEGHRRYLGFRKTISLDRKKLVELIDSLLNQTLSWDDFAVAVKEIHANRTGRPVERKIIPGRPKEGRIFLRKPSRMSLLNDIFHGTTSTNLQQTRVLT